MKKLQKIKLTQHEWYDALKVPTPHRNKKKYYRNLSFLYMHAYTYIKVYIYVFIRICIAGVFILSTVIPTAVATRQVQEVVCMHM